MGYYRMNGVLRAKDRTHVRKWRDAIWHLLASMRKLPKVSARVLHRGAQLEASALGKQCMEGEEFVWSGFSSTTKHVSAMKDFLGKDGPRVMWILEMMPTFLGRDLSEFSFFDNEREILLAPQLEFKVVATLELGHGLVQVQCEQVQET